MVSARQLLVFSVVASQSRDRTSREQQWPLHPTMGWGEEVSATPADNPERLAGGARSLVASVWSRVWSVVGLCTFADGGLRCERDATRRYETTWTDTPRRGERTPDTQRHTTPGTNARARVSLVGRSRVVCGVGGLVLCGSGRSGDSLRWTRSCSGLLTQQSVFNPQTRHTHTGPSKHKPNGTTTDHTTQHRHIR